MSEGYSEPHKRVRWRSLWHKELYLGWWRSPVPTQVVMKRFNPLSAKSTKWPNTLKQFVSYCRRIVWMCLTILWLWHLKVLMSQKNVFSKVASSKPVVLPQNRAPPNMFHKFAWILNMFLSFEAIIFKDHLLALKVKYFYKYGNLRKYDTIKICRWYFFKFSWVVH